MWHLVTVSLGLGFPNWSQLAPPLPTCPPSCQGSCVEQTLWLLGNYFVHHKAMYLFLWVPISKPFMPGILKQQIFTALQFWRLQGYKSDIQVSAGPHALCNLQGESFASSIWYLLATLSASWLVDVPLQYQPLSSRGHPLPVCLCLCVSSLLLIRTQAHWVKGLLCYSMTSS